MKNPKTVFLTTRLILYIVILTTLSQRQFTSTSIVHILSSVPDLEARWPSGRASDSGARDPGFNPHSGRRVVYLSKIHLLRGECLHSKRPGERSQQLLQTELPCPLMNIKDNTVCGSNVLMVQMYHPKSTLALDLYMHFFSFYAF